MSTNSQFAHKIFRDYFFENGDQFFFGSKSEKISILNEIWDKNFENLDNTKIKPDWEIITYVVSEQDEVSMFQGCTIFIIKMPTPKIKDEVYFIGLGVGGTSKDSIMIPIYMLLELIDGQFTCYSEYTPKDEITYKYFYINKPLEPCLDNFVKSIVLRLKQFSIEITIPARLDSKGNEISYNSYQIVDKYFDIDGYIEIANNYT